MQIISDFVKEFLYQIIFTAILSSGFFAVYYRKLRLMADFKALGICRIYKCGNDIKSTKKHMSKSKQIMQISYLPYQFIYEYRLILEKALSNGCAIKLLMCEPESELLKEAVQMENGDENKNPDKFESLIKMLQSMKMSSTGTGTIEVRTFNAEIRNPVTIYSDKSDNLRSFLTVSIPPKRSRDCCMIEYDTQGSKDIITYFNTIWNRHNGNVKLKI